MNYEIWIPIINGVVGTGGSLFFSYQQLNMSRMQQGLGSTPKAATRQSLSRYWPMAAMFVLMLGCWIPYYVGYPVDYFRGWGGLPGNPSVIWAVIDGHKLFNKRPDRVMLIARVLDLTVDSKSDTEIAKSATFQILDVPTMRIDVKLSPEFAAKMNTVGRAEEYLLLVPDNFPVESVHSVDDATSRGAKILGMKVGGGGTDERPYYMSVPSS